MTSYGLKDTRLKYAYPVIGFSRIHAISSILPHTILCELKFFNPSFHRALEQRTCPSIVEPSNYKAVSLTLMISSSKRHQSWLMESSSGSSVLFSCTLMLSLYFGTLFDFRGTSMIPLLLKVRSYSSLLKHTYGDDQSRLWRQRKWWVKG